MAGEEDNLDDLEAELEMLTRDVVGDERKGPRAAANEIENIDERDLSENKRKLAEEQALLAQLESLTVGALEGLRARTLESLADQDTSNVM